MTIKLWLLFATTEALLCITPGPAVLFVLSYGLSQGGRASLWANAGILSCNAFYFFLSALGLGAVLLASYDVFTVLKFCGAAYLVYLGIQTIRGAGLAFPAAQTAQPQWTGWRALTRGVVLQAANPKAIFFFIALLPQFIDTRTAVVPQILILGITSVAIEFFVLAGYGYLAGRAAAVVRRRKFVSTMNRVSGGMLVAAGAGLAVASDR